MSDDGYDWYFEHVVVGGRPPRPGPAARRQLAWQTLADSLRQTSPIADLALTQGLVATSRQTLECGGTYADVRRSVRRGEWTAPRRGVVSVVPGDDGTRRPHGMSPEIRASAALAQLRC